MTETLIRIALRRREFTLDVDVALPGRGIAAIFGASGAGKSTLLRCVAGLEAKASGRVQVAGDTWQDDERGTSLPTWRRPLGYVFQEASLFDHLDVGHNLGFGLRRSRGAGFIALEAVVELLGIGHLLARHPHELSGGERQRVAIARALATQPRILLLDEPLASLDLPRRREILPWLEKLRDELRIPMLYVTHAIDEVARLAQHMVVLHDGRVRACGSVEEIFARLDLPLVQEEDAGAVLTAVVAARDEPWHLMRADFAGGSLWLRDEGLALGTTVRLRVLARDVSIAQSPPGHSSIQNVLACEVESLAPGSHPSQVMVRLRCGGSIVLAKITARAADALALVPRLPVHAQVKAVSIVA